MLPVLVNDFLASGDFFDNILPDYRRTTSDYPRLDIYEDDKAIYIEAEVAGFNKKDVKVAVKDGIISITGEKKETKKEKENNYYRKERYYGSFERRFKLPADIDSKKIKAETKDGVLNISIPKTEYKENIIDIEVK